MNMRQPEPDGFIASSMTSARRALQAVTTWTVRAVKQPIKDAWWTALGSQIANPPFPAHVGSILFVCKGNICRSPFAAAIAKQRLVQAGQFGVHCDSAGIRADQAATPPPDAVMAASKFNISLKDHRPSPLSRCTLARYDLIVVMEARQSADLRADHPEAAEKIFLLPLIGRATARGYARYNIADPFGHPSPAFDYCYRRIDVCVADLLEATQHLHAARRRAL
jgi:protein-tyrosine phosphatase